MVITTKGILVVIMLTLIFALAISARSEAHLPGGKSHVAGSRAAVHCLVCGRGSRKLFGVDDVRMWRVSNEA